MMHPSYKENMTFREFLEARRDHMEAERDQCEQGSSSWNFYQGRMLSYLDALYVVDGGELIPSVPNKKFRVEAA